MKHRISDRLYFENAAWIGPTLTTLIDHETFAHATRSGLGPSRDAIGHVRNQLVDILHDIWYFEDFHDH